MIGLKIYCNINIIMSSEIEKTAHFCMFLLFNFSSIFRGGQLTQFAPVRAASRGKWGQLTCGRPCSLPSLLGLLSHPRFTHSLPYSSLLLCLSLARRSVLLSTLPIVDDLPARRNTPFYQYQPPRGSILFFSRPGSEGWPHHVRTMSIYLCPLSF